MKSISWLYDQHFTPNEGFYLRHCFVQCPTSWRVLCDLVHPYGICLDVFTDYVVHETARSVGLDGSGRGVRSGDLVAAVKECGSVISAEDPFRYMGHLQDFIGGCRR